MKNKTLKILGLALITLAWVAGVVCMFAGAVRVGLLLWSASIILGFVEFLFQRHRETLEEVVKAEEQAEKEKQEADKGENEA